MLSELQKRKLTQLFHLYDVDGDGYLATTDYAQVVVNLARIRGYERGTPAYEALEGAFMGIWARLQRSADADRDQRVSLDEFLVRYDVMLRQPEVVESVIILLAEVVAQIADQDENGRIDRAEFVASMAAYGVSALEAQECFGYLDRTGDGSITRDELLMNVREFLCSDSPVAPGNWLFGKF